MTSQNNSSNSNNNNASWYIFSVKSRDKSSQAITGAEEGAGSGVSMYVLLGLQKKNQDHQVKASFFNGLCQP